MQSHLGRLSPPLDGAPKSPADGGRFLPTAQMNRLQQHSGQMDRARLSHGSFPLRTKNLAVTLPRAVPQQQTNPFSQRAETEEDFLGTGPPKGETRNFGRSRGRDSHEYFSGSSARPSGTELSFGMSGRARPYKVSIVKKNAQYFSPKSPSSFRFSFSQEGGADSKQTRRNPRGFPEGGEVPAAQASQRAAGILSQQQTRQEKASLMETSQTKDIHDASKKGSQSKDEATGQRGNGNELHNLVDAQMR